MIRLMQLVCWLLVVGGVGYMLIGVMAHQSAKEALVGGFVAILGVAGLNVLGE